MTRALEGLLVLDLGQIYNGPYRGMLRDVAHPTMGRVTTFGTPPRLSESEPVPSAPAPLNGRHFRDALRRHLDLTDAELDRLAADQVI